MSIFANRLMLSCFALACLMAAKVPAVEKDKRAGGDQPKLRVFRIDYGATLKGLSEGAQVRVWLPVPPSNDHQQVEALKSSLPAEGKTAVEPKYGNQILFFETQAPSTGRVSFETPYLVKRREVRGLANSGGSRRQLTDQQRRLFLAANTMVPLAGKPLELLADVALPDDDLARARALYNRVDEHVRYDKSQPGYGQGDVLWVCDSRFGNCTDFHSLFISLARAQDLPARFEIGFPLPPERGAGAIGGYHCWALFHADQQGWVPVDISEADKHPEMREYYFGNLTENRVTFSVGRDIDLLPKQAGLPQNFFVYPYVEVDGKPLAKDQIELRFKYRDVKRKNERSTVE